MVVENVSAQAESDSVVPLGIFVAVTLIASWTIAFVAISDTIPWYTTVLIMFTPAVVVLFIQRFQGKSVVKTVVSSVRGATAVSLLFVVAYPLLFIAIAAVIALTTGLGTYQPGADNVLFQIIQGNGVLLPIWIVLNLVLVYGEELGWRGYLLPKLTVRWGRISAATAVGVVWALYHSAFLYKAGLVLGVENPLLIAVVQAGAVFTMSFPFAYSYYLTNGSVLPAMILHLIWNIVNPWILGDIYGNVQGVVGGQVFMVNGEGFVGLVLGLIALGGFIVLFRRETHIRGIEPTSRP